MRVFVQDPDRRVIDVYSFLNETVVLKSLLNDVWLIPTAV